MQVYRGYNFISFPLGNVFSYNLYYNSVGNTAHLSSSGANYFSSSSLTGIGIWNGSQTIEYKSVNISELEIISSDNLTFNSTEFSKIGFPATYILYNSSDNLTDVKMSQISIDGVVRYVPVRLLKDLPSTLDANNKFRPAGTCGMWDKVNNKFYGNTSSKGSFTVTDD